MQFPALTSLTSRRSGAFTEDFRKIFKPSGLIAATVFMALKLVLLLAALRNAGVSAVVALEQLTTVWRLPLGALFFFTLAYVLNSLSPVFFSLAIGAAIKDSPIISRGMKELRKWHYKHLHDDVLKGSNRRKAATLWQVVPFLGGCRKSAYARNEQPRHFNHTPLSLVSSSATGFNKTTMLLENCCRRKRMNILNVSHGYVTHM
jgi:hypothetical protein